MVAASASSSPGRGAAHLALALVVVGAAAAAPAQEPPAALTARLDPLSVIGTRSLQPAFDPLADVTVIGPEEIARAGPESLSALLQRQPGVEIVQNGGPGSVSGVFLRGANSQQTLVLVDGMRVGSSTTGASTLEAIPLDQIERIEILRGPASSLYGADAIGGVILIFTRRGGRDFAADASAGYGTHATSNAAGGVSGNAGPLQFAVHAGATRSAGFNAITNPANASFNDDRDGYRNSSASASVALPWADGQEVSAQYFRSRLDAQFDAGPGSDDRTITTVETWQAVSRNRVTPLWVSQLTAGEGVDDSVSLTGFGDFPFRTTQRQYAWQNEFTLPLGGLTAGWEKRRERVDSESGFAVTGRDTDSLFGLYQLRDGPFALQANLRRDDSSQYGGRTTGAIAFGYRVAPSLRVTFAGSTGFKPPSFNDLYYPGYSNPSLAPETSRNLEVGATWYGTLGDATLEARAIAYRNRVRELIVLECDASFNCIPQNVARARLEGMTLGLDARFGATSLAASLDLGRPEDELTGKLLPRRARTHGALKLGHAIGAVRLGAEVVASSVRYDTAANTRALGGYGIVNLTAEWTIARNWSAFLRADNAFDKRYELAADYATGGATIFAGLRWRL